MADFTERTFLEGITEGTVVTAEQAAFAAKRIEALNKRNEKRKATPSKTAIENAPMKEKIVEFLEGKGPTPANAIGEGVGITTQKASALARQLVEAGELTVAEAKIPKKGAVKVYALAPVVEVELDEGAEEPEA
jgi:predicted transcriptional regulator